jgi:hypothetical protein
MSKKRTHEDFVSEAINKHGNCRFDYSIEKYNGLHKKIKIKCIKHNFIFEQKPVSHLRSDYCCPKCAYEARSLKLTKTKEEVLDIFHKVHGNLYDYSLFEYNGIEEKGIIICKLHGIFHQKPIHHIHKASGCPECGKKKTSSGGYSFDFFKNFPEEKHKKSFLYLVEMKFKKEHFYKIGITIRSLNRRFSNKEYKIFEIIPIICYEEYLFNNFIKETEIKNELKDFKYYPNIEFGGYTECFKPKQEVINYIQGIINE